VEGVSLVAPTISVVAVTSPTPKPSEIFCWIGAMEEIPQIKPLKLLGFHHTSSVVTIFPSMCLAVCSHNGL